MGHCSRNPGSERRRFFELKRYVRADRVLRRRRRACRRKKSPSAESTSFLRPFLRPPCPSDGVAHQPSLTNSFFHSSADIGLSLTPYTAFICTMSVNMPRCLPIETSAACLSCILMRSEPLAFCETSAIAAAASSLILAASTIVTRGIGTITGSPSSPFSVRVTSSLRHLTTLRMSEKPRSLSSRTTCSTVTSARLPQAIQKHCQTGLPCRAVGHANEHADAPHVLAGLLRARRERPCRRRAAEQRDEIAPSELDCHVTLPWGVMPIAMEGGYHAFIARSEPERVYFRPAFSRIADSVARPLSVSVYAPFSRLCAMNPRTAIDCIAWTRMPTAAWSDAEQNHLVLCAKSGGRLCQGRSRRAATETGRPCAGRGGRLSRG